MAHGKMRPDVFQEVNRRLGDMVSFGESKRAAMKEGKTGDRIFSSNTLKGYRHECQAFARWAADHSPKGRFVPFEDLRELAPLYLSDRIRASVLCGSPEKLLEHKGIVVRVTV